MSALYQRGASPDYENLIHVDRVHASLYVSDEVFHDEMERLFYRGWTYVGHESEVAVPNSYATKPLGLQSVILTRHEDGSLHVLHNRCTHRAARVVDAEQGSGARLQCRYHGWSFNLRGDLMTVPSAEGYGANFDKSGLGLVPVPRVASYGGFVFASMARTGITLEEHLGAGRAAIDQINGLAPGGSIALSAGWMKQRIKANWKMIIENQVDGYHAPFTHGSLIRANRRFGSYRDRRESSPAKVRDFGMGHSEIDHASDYRDKGNTLRWSGNIEESRLPGYVAAMNAAYGFDEARRRMIDGPPHTAIFPNLFLAEMAIMVVNPVSAGETIHITAPVMLKGGDDLNIRTLRRGEGAVGPAGFIIADDIELSELAQVSAANEQPEWLLLARGLHSEQVHADGTRTAGLMDETTQRAFWRQYKKTVGVPS